MSAEGFTYSLLWFIFGKLPLAFWAETVLFKGGKGVRMEGIYMQYVIIQMLVAIITN